MSITSTKLLTFPNPVNEYAARSVAGMVLVLAVATLIFRSPWLLWPLALRFTARVAAGPRFWRFGLLATRVIAPGSVPRNSYRDPRSASAR